MNNIIHTIRHTARATAVLLIALLAAQTAGAQEASPLNNRGYDKVASQNMLYLTHSE